MKQCMDMKEKLAQLKAMRAGDMKLVIKHFMVNAGFLEAWILETIWSQVLLWAFNVQKVM